MINEPTSLAYGLYKMDKEIAERRIVVIDFGGGTLDFTSLIFTKEDDEIIVMRMVHLGILILEESILIYL